MKFLSPTNCSGLELKTVVGVIFVGTRRILMPTWYLNVEKTKHIWHDVEYLIAQLGRPNFSLAYKKTIMEYFASNKKSPLS